MSKRPKYDVSWMTEGDILVRGTLDSMLALKLIVDTMDEESAGDDLLWGVAPPYEENRPGYLYPTPEECKAAVEHIAWWCYNKLTHATSGHFRKVHQLPGMWGYEEYTWELQHVAHKGRGTFEGVYFYD